MGSGEMTVVLVIDAFVLNRQATIVCRLTV